MVGHRQPYSALAIDRVSAKHSVARWYAVGMFRIAATIQNGAAIPDRPIAIPDGTSVYIEIPGREWLLRFVGIWGENGPDVLPDAAVDGDASSESADGDNGAAEMPAVVGHSAVEGVSAAGEAQKAMEDDGPGTAQSMTLTAATAVGSSPGVQLQRRRGGRPPSRALSTKGETPAKDAAGALDDSTELAAKLDVEVEDAQLGERPVEDGSNPVRRATRRGRKVEP